MPPQLLDLSTELLIQILAYGSLRDIGACARTSRRLYAIVSGSQYLRYLLRTKMAGVHDPFLLSGLSIQERLSALERWERAWHNLDLQRQPALQCIVPRDISVSTLRYEIHGGYLVGARRFPVDADRPLGYSYFDLHEAIGRGYPSWNNVDLHRSLSVFSYCFNVEEHNLAVMLVYDSEEQPEPRASLRMMDFRTGNDHPLATTPNIQLQFGGKVMNVHDAYYAHMEVADDNVVVMIAQARALPDYIFLVGWKSGKVSLILTAPDLTYAASFALINTKLLALVNLQTNTLDIHHIVDDGTNFALQRVETLFLPFSRTNGPSLFASFRLAQAYSPSSCPSRHQCLPFYPSPDARLLGLTVYFAAQDGTMSFNWLAIRTEYLCSIADTKKRDPSSDGDATASGDLGPTPWEKWSHGTAFCVEIEHPLAAPTPAGGRWLLHSQPLVVREFGLSRSRTIQLEADAAADRIQRTTHHDSDQGIGKAVLRETLQDAFASQLPYCDITVSMGERKYQSVIADHEWVIGLNNEGDDFSRSTHHTDIHHIV